MDKDNKKTLAKMLGVSRQLLYYDHLQPKKDWLLKTEIEKTLRNNPSYGHKKLAKHLGVGKNRVLRVMKIYGIKPYRRKDKKFKYIKAKKDKIFNNLLLSNYPEYPNHIWASDFTHIAKYNNKWVYLATILDLYTRQIVGFSVLLNHSVQLVINALMMAVSNNNIPKIIHSDQGSEYASRDYSAICTRLGIKQSMSNPGSPWENGYQESFYDKFKIDLGDPNRFVSLGELVYNIYQQIYYYNHSRIHSALDMAPVEYAQCFILNKQLNSITNSFHRIGV
ncbi:MAG: hypothetical protein COV55_03380 [Candidatus Komeilibacteria bacterium CG11_big_fil_rev_8_21_14_0_20_36_20]|uniref:Integrase catalytic domain-containing protein n=1 Tax=Candidatus Komeilibacteria bacterium CG11_big_fil_rev_8_21_14_0_20_36_20 TaxID=1974477 RepID=A0A2H0NCC5_9BACT|nr:MAG: hypothetical protein COV55_03380 [Candidatus Komeilibacteria bacterium CG11_big_fil_rev_8_21_14_0_20_36_20]PIR81875.1 MAG: hypothetical protein COU21_00825 [Candidatus Komeilibacteria bacterium CG10_big_fil_rev_8_21_14_0_10_36_65]PJC54916.1 MAG: hypothetical protein CO027_04770 [Candidatus Komeilibacteria bacterium CG_4_9_14_0_2_um_filter_36_13]